jgi:hypothetical protein
MRHLEQPAVDAALRDRHEDLLGLLAHLVDRRAQLGRKHVQLAVGHHRQHRAFGMEAHVRADPAADLLARVGLAVQQHGAHAAQVLVVGDAHELGEHVLLGRVVRVDGRALQAASGGDVADRGAGIAALSEQAQRGFQDQPPGGREQHRRGQGRRGRGGQAARAGHRRFHIYYRSLVL